MITKTATARKGGWFPHKPYLAVICYKGWNPDGSCADRQETLVPYAFETREAAVAYAEKTIAFRAARA